MSTKENDQLFRNNQGKIFEKLKEINLNLEGYFPSLNAYYELKKENPELITREVLLNHTKSIMAAQNLVLSNFHQVLGKMIQLQLPNTIIKNLGIINELAPILKYPIPANVQNSNISNTVLDFVDSNFLKYIIIIQGENPDVISFLKNCRVRSVALIHINFEKEKLDSIILVDDSSAIQEDLQEFVHVLNESTEDVFPSPLPILQLTQMPNDNQLNLIIGELIKWINKKDKVLTDLVPVSTIPVAVKGGNQGDGQMASRMSFRTRIKSSREGRIIFKFATSELQCSPYRLHIYLDDEEKIVTDWFGYSGNGVMSTPILNIITDFNKFYELKLQPEGKQEGCNEGFIAGWEGTLYTY